MKQLEGHRALVTGGTHGVGGAIAVAIAAAGGDVCLIGGPGKDAKKFAEETAARCRSFGVQAEWLLQDMSVQPAEYLETLLSEVDKRLPDVDLLVNNVGTCIDVPFLEMDFEKFQRTLNTSPLHEPNNPRNGKSQAW